MKFGRNLHRYQVVEWAPFYIDYVGLKQLYKAAKSLIAVDNGEDANLTGLPCTILLSALLIGCRVPSFPGAKSVQSKVLLQEQT